MLQGMIIGGLTAIIVLGIQYWRSRNIGKTLLLAQRQGPEAFMRALDKAIPRNDKVNSFSVQHYLNRLAWMAIAGDHQRLSEELAAQRGSLLTRTQIRLIGYSGLLAHRSDASDLQGLEAAAQEVHAQGGFTASLLKKWATYAVALGHAIAGRAPLDQEAVRWHQGRANQSPVGQKVMMLRFAGRALQSAGEDPSLFFSRADEALRLLD